MLRRHKYSEFTDFPYTALYEMTYQFDQLEHGGLKKYTDQGLDISTKIHLLFYPF